MITAPSAVADVMALLTVISDPKTAKTNLEALAAFGDQLTAKSAELESREKAVAEQLAANDAAAAKYEADLRGIENLRAAQERNLQAVATARAALDKYKTEQADIAAANAERAKELNDRASQLDQAQLDLKKMSDEFAAEVAQRSKAIDDREAEVAKAEADAAERYKKLGETVRALNLAAGGAS